MKLKRQNERRSKNGPQTRSTMKLVDAFEKGCVKKTRHGVSEHRRKAMGFKLAVKPELLRISAGAENVPLVVRKLPKYKPAINNSGKSEATTLWTALKNHQADMATILIRAGANINGCPNALHAAIEIGCDELTRLLIERGADVNARDARGNSVLRQAMRFKASTGIVAELLQRGADVSENVLLTAARSSTELLMILVNWGLDVEARHRRAASVLREIVSAPEEADTTLVRELLATGVPVHRKTGDLELTILERAVVAGKRVMVETLLDHGAGVEENLGPLFFAACRHSDSSIAKLLAKKGSSVHACNALGQTPLFAACQSGSYACIDLLLELGVDFNKVDEKGHVAHYYLENTLPNLTCRALFVHHVALSVSRGATVHSENLTLIEGGPVTDIFYKACAMELEKMKSAMICKNFTLHSVLTMGSERLSSRMRDAKFDKKLKSRLSRVSTYRLYGEQVKMKVNIAEKRRAMIVSKIEVLSNIFSGILPLLVIEKIAYYSCCDKLFELRIDSI